MARPLELSGWENLGREKDRLAQILERAEIAMGTESVIVCRVLSFVNSQSLWQHYPGGADHVNKIQG